MPHFSIDVVSRALRNEMADRQSFIDERLAGVIARTLDEKDSGGADGFVADLPTLSVAKLEEWIPDLDLFDVQFVEKISQVLNRKFQSTPANSASWVLVPALAEPEIVSALATAGASVFGAGAALSLDFLLEPGIRQELGGMQAYEASIARARGPMLTFEIDRSPMEAQALTGTSGKSVRASLGNGTATGGAPDPDPMDAIIERVKAFLRRANGEDLARGKRLLREIEEVRKARDQEGKFVDYSKLWGHVNGSCRPHVELYQAALARDRAAGEKLLEEEGAETLRSDHQKRLDHMRTLLAETPHFQTQPWLGRVERLIEKLAEAMKRPEAYLDPVKIGRLDAAMRLRTATVEEWTQETSARPTRRMPKEERSEKISDPASLKELAAMRGEWEKWREEATALLKKNSGEGQQKQLESLVARLERAIRLAGEEERVNEGERLSLKGQFYRLCRPRAEQVTAGIAKPRTKPTPLPNFESLRAKRLEKLEALKLKIDQTHLQVMCRVVAEREWTKVQRRVSDQKNYTTSEKLAALDQSIERFETDLPTILLHLKAIPGGGGTDTFRLPSVNSVEVALRNRMGGIFAR